MAMIPMVSNFEGDFVLQLVAVDDHFTMDEVAQACAAHSLNRRVKPRPGAILRVKEQDETQPLARTMTVKEAGLQPMATIEIYFQN